MYCDGLEMILTVSGEKSDGSASAAGTTSTSNTVNVILRVVGVVIVEHVSDVLDVFETRKMLVKCYEHRCELERAKAIPGGMRNLSRCAIMRTPRHCVDITLDAGAYARIDARTQSHNYTTHVTGRAYSPI